MQIRTLTAQADHFDTLLSGHIEADEAYVGGCLHSVSAVAAHPARRSLWG